MFFLFFLLYKYKFSQNGNSRCNLNIVTRSRSDMVGVVAKLRPINDTSSMNVNWDPNNQCVDGYVGPLCMSCDKAKGFLLNATKFCELCVEGKPDIFGAAIFLLILSICLAVIVFIVLSRTSLSETKVQEDTEEADHLSDVIKILITYMQILSVLAPTYSSIAWPGSFKSYTSGMSIINLDVAFLLPVASCRFSIPYREKLYLHLASPLLFFISVQIALGFCLVLGLKCGTGEAVSSERRKVQKNKASYIFLEIMQLMCE